MEDLYRGSLVRLGYEEPDVIGRARSLWERDSEMHRLADNDPAILWSEKKMTAFIGSRSGEGLILHRFAIRTLVDDVLIGEVNLQTRNWVHGEGWVGIAIGDRNYWGRGFGTDAMRLILRFAFLELNLRRVSLGVYAYNPRAQRSYEKAGFKLEGCMRGECRRDGQQYDSLWMGILREEWEALQ